MLLSEHFLPFTQTLKMLGLLEDSLPEAKQKKNIVRKRIWGGVAKYRTNVLIRSTTDDKRINKAKGM